MLFVGSNRRLTRQILHQLAKLGPVFCPDGGMLPLSTVSAATPENAGGDRPLVAAVTWADVLRDGPVSALIERISELRSRTGNRGPVTICAVPYAAFCSSDSDTRVWLRSTARDELEVGQFDPVAALVAGCLRIGLEARVVAAPMLLVPRVHEIGEYPSFFNKVLGIGRSLTREVLDKAPAYFDRYPLSLQVDASETPNMMTPSTLARWLVDTACDTSDGDELYGVDLRCSEPWLPALEATRVAGFALSVGDPASARNALDLLFNELVFENRGMECDEYRAAATFRRATADADDHVTTILDICSAAPLSWESTYRTAHEYDLGTMMMRRERLNLATDGGSRASIQDAYYDGGGAGPNILMLAPIGIDPGYFGNLAAELMFDHRVLIWMETASEDSESDPSLRPHAQATAVRRVLEDARIRSCHIVGWCVGIHVVDALLRECPSLVASVTLFSPDIDGDRQPTREYKSLMDLFTLVAHADDAAAIVSSAKRVLRMSAASDVEQYKPGTAASPLQYRSAALARRAVRVFDDPAHVVRWARHFLDIAGKSDLSGVGLREYQGPVLSIIGTHDSLLDVTALKMRCAALTHGAIVTIQGGNHYVLTEHAPSVGELLRHFVRHGSVATGASLVDACRVLIEPSPRRS